MKLPGDECSSLGQSAVPSFEGDAEKSSGVSGELDDDSSESGLERTKSGCLEFTASTEMLRIRFPFQSISVRLSDFLCLQENVGFFQILLLLSSFFYFEKVHLSRLNINWSKRITVLPSVFWHNLSILQCGVLADEANKNLTDDQMLDARFGDVLDFVEDFDFIDVDYIVVPVNEWEHWSLVIVCHPFTARARMICFDSQLTDDLNNLQNISDLCDEFLKYVWLRRQMYPLCSTERMRCIIPENLPQQENNFDCGLYIVEFARRFLLAPPRNLDSFNFTAEYPDFTVKNKRRDIQHAVLSLCSNREFWTPILDLLNKKL
ncbi:Ulp1 protease family, catalytic domain protein [Oesophagostomum dentatum]|uniref:Ulp1 protease family, catalytic domain protein n=1 Tax=Oesophagostomum dentatum TaxID=61180 RepID=A0A0B1T6X7_OESDE|nr:Ulp1 protease family, catalytic domain protein [Oesophagostomum dentatum]